VRDEMSRELLGGGGLPAPVLCPTVTVVPARPITGRMLLHVDHYDGVGPESFERMEAVAKEFASLTERGSRRTNNLIARGSSGQLEQLLDLYAAADLVLSSRLHGCIIALATGRRVLAVSGDHKVEAFMRAAGLSDWVLDPRQIASLPGRLELLPEQRLPVEFIEAGRRQNREVASRIVELIDVQAFRPAAR
jgi:hypothetical protein